MKILAIDTSSSVCSTALLEDNNLIDENNLDDGKTHSENLMPLVKELLERNKVQLSEINLIAVSCGPGSFTGIRIGIASVKAMAEVHNIPIAEVTSLETLACNDISEKNKISLIDAKNNQVYAGIFDKEYNLLEDYMADDINIIFEKISKYKNAVLIGNGAILHKNILKNIDEVEFLDNNIQSAYCTGKIGYKKYLEDDLKNADTVMPIYLRKSQAERMKK
jgi:tRNA threonylcarbamoyl adenosine modification protein YeaZ